MCKCTTYVGKIFLISLLCLCVHVGASVEVLVDQSDRLQGIFFQDQEMKDIFSAYPELVCVDGSVGGATADHKHDCRCHSWCAFTGTELEVVCLWYI